MENKTHKILSYLPLILFILIETTIFILFSLIDVGVHISLDTTITKYVGMIFIVIFEGHLFKKIRSINLIYMFASILTLGADYCLLVKGEYYELGVSIFICVQIFYCRYLYKINNKENFKIILITYLSIFAILLTAELVLHMFSVLNLLVIIYFPLLITNFIYSLVMTIKHFSIVNLLMTIGLFLFIMCDLNVGLSSIDYIYETNYKLFDFACMSIWFFYFPSQVIMQTSYQLQFKSKDNNEITKPGE